MEVVELLLQHLHVRLARARRQEGVPVHLGDLKLLRAGTETRSNEKHEIYGVLGLGCVRCAPAGVEAHKVCEQRSQLSSVQLSLGVVDQFNMLQVAR